ncbi:acyl carrier protein [Virgibacillus proomii]|uniref:acyl carrier protein n=1 Tax=Virgibacillus proomii TaxID=84407 RepID=UPI001C11D238|nr:acyl carrier protein [Virgibacillus proomii]MBU5265935.1 acyl carrier protein [Virgibacillus proomii]
MSERILNKLLKIFREELGENINVASIKGEDEINSLGINSVSFIKVLVAIESAFDFEFNDEDLISERFVTINDLVQYIEENIE